MKIISKKVKPIPVGDIDIGDVFEYNGSVYMVIYDRFNKKLNNNEVEVLCLSNGTVEYLDGREIAAHEVNCELIVFKSEV